MNKRQRRIEELKRVFLVDIPINPESNLREFSEFDSSVLDILDRLITTWADEEQPMTTEQAEKWMEENLGEDDISNCLKCKNLQEEHSIIESGLISCSFYGNIICSENCKDFIRKQDKHDTP